MNVVIPVEGLVHVYTPGTLPLFSVQTPVRIDLGREGASLGSVVFGLHASPVNSRATELTYLLTGAYVQVQGEALFDVDDETLLTEALEEVR